MERILIINTYVYNALLMVLLTISIYSQSIYFIICSTCQVLFFVVEQVIRNIFHRYPKELLQKYKKIGWILLLPTTGVIIGSIALLFIEDTYPGKIVSYILVGTGSLLGGSLFLDIIGRGAKEKHFSPLTWVCKWCGLASLSPLFSIVVRALLITNSPKEAKELSIMSGSVFGACGILVSINMILVSLCGYISTIESIRIITAFIKNKKWVFKKISLIKDGFLVLGKTVLSIVTFSVFMFVNALYSFGMGTAKYLAIKMKDQDKAQQVKSYRLVGIVITLTSLSYALYSTRLFMGQKTTEFPMVIGLIIACYTFLEFGIHIKAAIQLWGQNDLESAALKFISFSSTMVCFVLTQTAILSFANEKDSSKANGLAGIVFGGLAGATGIYMIIRSYCIKTPPESTNNL